MKRGAGGWNATRCKPLVVARCCRGDPLWSPDFFKEKEDKDVSLSEKAWDFWRENGYVVVHNAVPQENLDAMVDTIWTFLEMDRDDPEDWYKYKPYYKNVNKLI